MSINELEYQTIELDNHLMRWLFAIETGVPPSKEHKDQIRPLNKKVARYLWDYKCNRSIGKYYPEIGKYFKDVIELENGHNILLRIIPCILFSYF